MTNENSSPDAKENTYRAIAAAHSPIVYSDGVLSYSIGSQVSRIVFGIETRPGTEAAPVATLVLPTDALIAMIGDLRKVLTAPEVRQDMIDAAMRSIQKSEELG